MFKSESFLKERGFLQLTAELRGEHITFVNVLSTDNNQMSNLESTTAPDHVSLVIGDTTYFVNTSGSRLYTDKEITTDALVYAEKTEGYIAMRVTKLVSNGDTKLKSDNPVCIAFKDGKVKVFHYSASEKTEMTLKITSEPREIIVDGNKIDTWEYDKKNCLTFILSKGTGVITIK